MRDAAHHDVAMNGPLVFPYVHQLQTRSASGQSLVAVVFAVTPCVFGVPVDAIELNRQLAIWDVDIEFPYPEGTVVANDRDVRAERLHDGGNIVLRLGSECEAPAVRAPCTVDRALLNEARPGVLGVLGAFPRRAVDRPGSHGRGGALSLIHISEPTRLRRISYAVFC